MISRFTQVRLETVICLLHNSCLTMQKSPVKPILLAGFHPQQQKTPTKACFGLGDAVLTWELIVRWLLVEKISKQLSTYGKEFTGRKRSKMFSSRVDSLTKLADSVSKTHLTRASRVSLQFSRDETDIEIIGYADRCCSY